MQLLLVLVVLLGGGIPERLAEWRGGVPQRLVVVEHIVQKSDFNQELQDVVCGLEVLSTILL